VLFAPVLWVAVELFRGYAVDFPWNQLGTVLVDNIPLSRLASVTGVYGLSFEILLINVVFAMAFLIPRRQGGVLLVTSILAAILLQAGVLFAPLPLPADRTARLVQADVPILEANGWTREYFQQTLVSLANLSIPKPGELNPGEPRPDLIVWPESPAPFFLVDPQFRAAAGAVARAAGASLIVGSLGQPDPTDTGKLYNSAALFGPDGELKARYDKVHLVPFGEYVPFQNILSFASKLTREVGDFLPGTERQPISIDGERLGIFICYEAVFPNDVRQFANNGAQVFVNISNDGWFGDTAAPVQHLNMARMRAMENHRWLLRDTNTGITAVIDPYGRMVMSARRGVQTDIDVPYTLESQTTFYTRHGDWFAYACAIITLALLLGILRRNRLPRATS
jgi:apolipoprotein N-acyltransferase